MAKQLGIHYSTIFRHTLDKDKMFDKWVPYELTEQNLKSRLDVSTSILSVNRNTVSDQSNYIWRKGDLVQ